VYGIVQTRVAAERTLSDAAFVNSPFNIRRLSLWWGAHELGHLRCEV